MALIIIDIFKFLKKHKYIENYAHIQTMFTLINMIITMKTIMMRMMILFVMAIFQMAKKERDGYLERLHSFEKENQRLKDSVAIPCFQSTNVSDTDFSTMQAIKLENRAQALRNSTVNTAAADSQKATNSRDNLTSVLSHLRSKR